MKGGYILYNGKFLQQGEFLFPGKEMEQLCLTLKQSFRTENNEILFIEENFSCLIDLMNTVGINSPREWDLPRFRKDVSRLLNKNHYFLSAKVTIYFYTGINFTDYLLVAEEIPESFYSQNNNGILIDLYDRVKKACAEYNVWEFSSRFLWNTAKTSISQPNENLLFLNERDYVCEAIDASFGFVKDNIATFPAKEIGGYYPPLIHIVVKIAKDCGFKINISKEITCEDLMNADEIFLINNTLGIQKVLGFKSRRFYSTKTTLLGLKLSEMAKQYVSRLN